jgi:3-oxoacyl-[acyl-carrier protein] reductase
MKTALVTGGTRGIGRAIVERLLAEEYNIVFTYHSKSEIADSMIKEFGANRVSSKCTKGFGKKEFHEWLKEIQASFGPIDSLVVNAGITRDAMFLTMTEENFTEVMSSNFLDSFLLIQMVAKGMVYRRSGSIVVLSSVAATDGSPGQTNYSASKGALISFAKTLGKELGPYQVRVNSVSPGFIETDMTKKVDQKVIDHMKGSIPLKRLGQAKEIANVVSFLLSSQASYIHGSNIVVDGGMT